MIVDKNTGLGIGYIQVFQVQSRSTTEVLVMCNEAKSNGHTLTVVEGGVVCCKRCGTLAKDCPKVKYPKPGHKK